MKSKYWILLAINIIILAPILYLSFFVFPTSDDFSYGVALKQNSFIDIQVERYVNWTSRYFATAVLTLSPIAFGSIKFFGVYTVFFFLLNLVGFNYFLRSLNIKSFRKVFLMSLSFMSIFTLLCCSLVENYFWLAGSVTYYLPSILMLFLLGSIIHSFNRNLLKDRLIMFLSIFIIGGCVEIYLIYCIGIFFCVNLYFYYLNNKVNPNFIVSFLLLLLIFGFVIFSPGNSARGGQAVNVDYVNFLFMSIRKLFAINLRYSLLGFVFLFSVVSILNIKIKFPKVPFLVFWILATLLAFQFVGIFITTYSLKTYHPPRVENLLIFTTFLFLFFIAVELNNKMKVKSNYLYLTSGLSFLILFLIPKNEFQNNNNLDLMYRDIFSGKAQNFKVEFLERDIKLKNCEDICELERFQNFPRSILFKDIDTDSVDYFNVALAKYYNLKTIKANIKKPLD